MKTPKRSGPPAPLEEAPPAYASSPCYQHEFDALPVDGFDRSALVALLNELLEGERAGARGLIDMQSGRERRDRLSLLDQIARDEARFCAMLSEHITRLGARPSRATGAFYDKLAAQPTLTDKLRLLDCGQSAVVLRLDRAIPRLADSALRRDLTEMRDVHRQNIERCLRLVDAGSTASKA